MGHECDGSLWIRSVKHSLHSKCEPCATALVEKGNGIGVRIDDTAKYKIGDPVKLIV